MSAPIGPEELRVAEGLSQETMARLERVIAELDAWRTRINLIGPKEWPRIWSRHVGDSVQLFDHIRPSHRVVDLGSGAGFPGLVVACAIGPGATGRVTMVESAGKKAAFLRAAGAAARLPADVLNERVEALAHRPLADIVTARAFAPLPRLLEYAAPWLEAGAVGLFHKGEHWKEELTEARKEWTLAHEAIPSRTGGSGVILKLSEARRVG